MMANRIVPWRSSSSRPPQARNSYSAAEDDSSSPPVRLMADLSRRLLRQALQHPGQIAPANVKGLSLAWIYRATSNTEGAIIVGTPPPPRPDGGGMPAAFAAFFVQVTIKSIPLQKDGVLYFTSTNNVYAVDALSGSERWHFLWQGPVPSEIVGSG